MLDFDDRLLDLLIAFEEAERAGQPVTPEELCRHCPKLLEPLRRDLAILKASRRIRPPGLDEARIATGTPARQGTGQDDPAPALVPGCEPVAGYRLEKQLGRGGFGEVWRAVGPGGLPVALKIIPLDDRAAAAAEVRALEALRDIRHPNLLARFGSWQVEGKVVLAMELADGSLADRLREVQAQGLPGIPFDELIGYMKDTAKALDHLHTGLDITEGKGGAAGVQHRDIKPGNLLLVGGGVKVADFGLARLLQHSVTAHSGTMTALYAAPEFFQGKTSQHSDQYSLAVTYCQLRGGRLPFSGDPAQVMAGHLHGQPDLTMLPESERPAVARALAKDPGQRWPSCTAFVQALAVMGRSVGNQLVLDPGTDSKELMPCLPRWPRRRGEWLEKIRSRPWLVVLLLAPVILGAMAVLLTCSRGWLSSPDRDRSVPPASKITEPVLVEPLVFRGPTVGVNGLAFLPGNRAVSCNEDGTLCLWDLTEGKPLSILMKHSGPLRCLAVSPDGKRVLAGGGAGHQTVPFWDVEARREVGCLRGHEHGVWGLAFLAGGDRAVSASLDGTVRVWDLSKQRELFRCQGCDLPDTRPVGYSRQVFSMACSRDGHRILCGLRSGVIRVFSAEDGKLVQSFAGHSQPVSCVAFLAGGKAASARCRNWEGEGEPDHTLRCWDLNQGIELICVPAPGAGVWCLLPLRDGRHLILSCEDGGVVLWDSQEKSMVRRWFGHPGPVTALALSADERQALSAGGGTLRLWSLTE
jgi:serine/threonine protein kinase